MPFDDSCLECGHDMYYHIHNNSNCEFLLNRDEVIQWVIKNISVSGILEKSQKLRKYCSCQHFKRKPFIESKFEKSKVL